MRKLLFILLFCPEILFAQLNLPEYSPEGKIIQKVGYATFNIRYGRPAARERKIMGGLVPYKKLWRTGAGKCSTLAFDQEVIISNKTIPAGIYAIVSIPDEKEWTVMLNTDTTKIYGDPSEYNTETEVVRLTVNPQKTGRFYESLSFELDIVRNDAVFYLAWENTQIHFPIATGSHERIVGEIRKALEKSPNDQVLLSEAAHYYLMNNEYPEKVLEWLNKALAIGEDWWAYEMKVEILERIKNYAEARKTTNALIAFLKRTRPEESQDVIQKYEEKMRGWPGN